MADDSRKKNAANSNLDIAISMLGLLLWVALGFINLPRISENGLIRRVQISPLF